MKMVLFLVFFALAGCGGTAHKEHPDAPIYVQAIDNKNSIASYIFDTLSTLRQLGSLEALADGLNIPEGHSVIRLSSSVSLERHYTSKVSLRMWTSANQCIETDSVAKYIQEAGFGAGTLVPGEASEGFERRVNFQARSSKNLPLSVSISERLGSGCVGTIYIQ